MLAYVLWYGFAKTIETPVFEARLAHFHQVLNDSPAQGFNGSATFKVEGATWVSSGEPAYEDWYFLNDSAALDTFSEAALKGAAGDAHYLVAPHISSSTAGLYRLRMGTDNALEADLATWISKPADLSYEDFDVAIALSLDDDTSLWQRQMTLGPTSEFCFFGNNHPFGTSPIVTSVVKRQRLWPRPSSS